MLQLWSCPRLKIKIAGLIIPILRGPLKGTTIQKRLKPQPCLRRQARWWSFSQKSKSQKAGLFFKGKASRTPSLVSHEAPRDAALSLRLHESGPFLQIQPQYPDQDKCLRPGFRL